MSGRPSLAGTLGRDAFAIEPHGQGYAVTWNGDASTRATTPTLQEAVGLIELGVPTGPDTAPHGANDVAPDGFRQAGYSDAAAGFPLPPAELAAFAAFVGAKGPESLPAAWRYAPNAWCLETWRIIVSAATAAGEGEPDPARALYLAARRGRPGSPDANTLKAYARAHAAIRREKA